jgi:4-amino-4-deoxy-L-arabinose transferase-like glycosyltransferase
LLIGGWCAFLFLYGVASGPPYRTESLRAIIGRECLHGHWLFPVLYGEPFLTKPPGQYVAIGLSSLPFGEVTAHSARIPSAFAATISVLLMYGLFRRVLNEHAAVLAALLIPTSVLWLDKVPSAEIDMSLVGWVTASLAFVYRVLAEPKSRHAALYWIASLLCMAGGTLTKWTAPAFFYLTLIPLMVWRGQMSLLFGWRHLLAVAVAGSMCVIWALAVAQQVGWETLVDTVRKEALYRFAPKPGSKGYPWSEVLTYPILVVAAHLPVAFFAVRTFRPSFWQQWDEHGRLLLQLLHCWTWPNLLFWSLVPNHNVRYSLPMSAGLMGLGVMGLLGTWNPFKFERGAKLIAYSFLALWLAAKVMFVEAVVPLRTARHNPEPIGKSLREVIPPDQPLYLFRAKDEGVLFYYGRPAVRLSRIEDLPGGAYAVLIRQEWEEWGPAGGLDLVETLKDQQGDPLIVIRSLRINGPNPKS